MAECYIVIGRIVVLAQNGWIKVLILVLFTILVILKSFFWQVYLSLELKKNAGLWWVNMLSVWVCQLLHARTTINCVSELFWLNLAGYTLLRVTEGNETLFVLVSRVPWEGKHQFLWRLFFWRFCKKVILLILNTFFIDSSGQKHFLVLNFFRTNLADVLLGTDAVAKIVQMGRISKFILN